MIKTTDVLSSTNDLLSTHKSLISRIRASQQHHRRRLCTLHSPPNRLVDLDVIPSPSASPSPSPPSSPASTSNLKNLRPDLPPAKCSRVAKYHNYVPEEETIRNDYSQRYVDGGEWPQNWVLGAEPERRFEEYPKQQRLLNLKKASVSSNCLPPTYLPHSSLQSLLPCKFDVILLDPPFSSTFTWDNLQDLPIPVLAADPSFVFMWVGSGVGEGLERGREVLAKWGYRRCEDVVWVKTNKTTNRGPGTDPPTTSLLTRTKQHCLIGIRGTVRRSTDSWFVHCNVDTDVIIWEGDSTDPTRKPPEMYTLIENFCLGTRRLEVFGKASSFRRGWITVLAEGHTVDESYAEYDGMMQVEREPTPWDKETWENGMKDLANGGKYVVPMTPDIDALRPKSPFRPAMVANGGGTNSSGTTTIVGAPRGGQFGDGNQGIYRGSAAQHQGGLGQGPNHLLVQPVVGLGTNTLGGMGLMDGMVPGVVGWPGMMGLGNLGVHGMGNMGGLVAAGSQGQVQMEPMGVGGFNGVHMQGMGMGWPGIGVEMQVQPQFMENQGMWDGVDGMMGVNIGAPIMMNGLGGMDQWGVGQYNMY